MLRASYWTTALIALAAGPALEASAPEQDPAGAILELTPDDCWGLVVVRNLEALDAGTMEILQILQIPAVGPAELFRSRLHLGPQIPTNGPLALIMLPSPTFAEFGQHTLLVLPCRDVQDWLAQVPTVQIDDHLWRAELVWGPTYVAERGGFAILGTTEDSTRAALSSERSLAGRFSGARRAHFGGAAANLWLNLRALCDSPAGQEWLATLDPPGRRSVFGASLVNSRAQFFAQLESVHLGLNLDRDGVRVAGTLSARQGSPLANLLAFSGSGLAGALQRLPDLPTILAGDADITPRQAQAAAGELDALLATPAVAAATKPDALTQLRASLQALITDVQRVTWSVAAVPPSPEGLLALPVLLEVPDAETWIRRLEETCQLLGGDLFPDPAFNTLYKSIGFERQTDIIDAAAISQIDIERPAAEKPAVWRGIRYGAAFGGTKLVVRVASPQHDTVALCLGGHAREMGRMMATLRGRESGLNAAAGVGAARAMLSSEGDGLLVFSAERTVQIARLLGRMQNRLPQAPPRLERTDAVSAVSCTYQHPHLRIDAVMPIDVLRGLKALLIGAALGPQTEPGP